jgi:hypothetical protein
MLLLRFSLISPASRAITNTRKGRNARHSNPKGTPTMRDYLADTAAALAIFATVTAFLWVTA